MTDEPVLLEAFDGAVAVVTLNRPRARNALSRALRSELCSALLSLDADPDCAVIILTGSDPAFCAGLDLREVDQLDLSALVGEPDPKSGERRPIPPISKPLIAAVNGPAFTGGLELALHADFIVASEHAVFADTHARVGVRPAWGLTVLLPRLIGINRAKQLSSTCTPIDAHTAERWGLVNQVVAHPELIPRCLELARDITRNDAGVVTDILRTYDAAAEVTFAVGRLAESAAFEAR